MTSYILRFCVATLALTLAMPTFARGALEYEAAVRQALALRNCAFDAADRRARFGFARQLALHLGVPAGELTPRSGAHHAALARAVADLAERGIVTVEGATVTLADCTA